MPHVSETLAILNLAANPFAADTPMASLFPGGERRAVLEKLQHLSRYSEDIVALIGPAGSGKSTIGDFFVRHAAGDQIVARARASLLTSPTQLLEEMFKAFVLDFPAQGSIADLKAALQTYFAAAHKQGRSVVLVVDDAHELGDDAFSLLIRLALTDNTDGAFHLVLLGEQQLHDMLDYTCPLRNNASQFTCLQLLPLTPDETRDYLRYRLNSVGFSQNDGQPFPFSKKQVEKIYKLAEGNPGSINAQARSMLESPQGAMAQLLPLLSGLPHQFPRTFPRNYAIAAAALVVVLLIAFISGGDDEQTDTQTTVSVPLQLPAADSSPSVSDAAPSVAAAAPSEPASSASSVAIVPEAASADTNPVPERPTPTVPAPVVTTVAEPIAEPVAQPAATPSAPASPTSAAADASANTQAGQRSRIMALPPGQYTLQLLGSSSRSNVEDFVRRQANSAMYWYETRNNGNPWFVVIHGAYASRSGAESALAGLSAELRNLQPWIRPVSAVQAEVQARN